MVQSVDGATDHVMDRYVPLLLYGFRRIELVTYSVMTPRILPDLIDVEQELFELPQRVRENPFPGSLRDFIRPNLGASDI